MKALDKRNETARCKAQDKLLGQPYTKLFIDSALTCPECDNILRRDGYNTECDCSIWVHDGWFQANDWTRISKSDTVKAIN